MLAIRREVMHIPRGRPISGGNNPPAHRFVYEHPAAHHHHRYYDNRERHWSGLRSDQLWAEQEQQQQQHQERPSLDGSDGVVPPVPDDPHLDVDHSSSEYIESDVFESERGVTQGYRAYKVMVNFEFRKILPPAPEKKKRRSFQLKKRSFNPNVDKTIAEAAAAAVPETKSADGDSDVHALGGGGESTTPEDATPKQKQNQQQQQPVATESAIGIGSDHNRSATTSVSRRSSRRSFVGTLLKVGAGISSDDCCSICLEHYAPGDVVARMRCLPAATDDDDGKESDANTTTTTTTKRCKHWFHKDCIMQWLENHDECPMCRVDMIHG
jgi:hypothetical protein